MSTSLDIEVRQLLEKKRGDWRSVCAACNVSHSWISQFMRNKIPNPGFVTLKKLHEHLSAESQEAA